MFAESEVPPDSRPFMLVIEEMDRLCHAYKNICDDIPGIFEYDYRTQENARQWRHEKVPLGF